METDRYNDNDDEVDDYDDHRHNIRLCLLAFCNLDVPLHFLYGGSASLINGHNAGLRNENSAHPDYLLTQGIGTFSPVPALRDGSPLPWTLHHPAVLITSATQLEELGVL